MKNVLFLTSLFLLSGHFLKAMEIAPYPDAAEIRTR